MTTFKRILMVMAFIVFLGVGYIGTSIITSTTCEAQTCRCQICIIPNSLVTALWAVYNRVTVPGVNIATNTLTAYFNMHFDVFDNYISNKIHNVTDNMLAWWDTFWWYNLKPSLQDIDDQVMTSHAEQAKALGEFADAANINRTKNEIASFDIDTHRETRPGDNVCVMGSASGGIARAAAFGKAYNTAADSESLLRSSNATGTAAAFGKGTDQKERWQAYVSNYCDSNLNGGHAGCDKSAPLAGRDLDVAGELLGKDTIDLTDLNTKKTIDTLTSNIVEPFVQDPVTPGALLTADGQKALLESESYKAKRQTIYDALHYIIARRAPGSRMGEFVSAVRTAAGIDQAHISANPSYHEVLQALTLDRFQTGQFGVSQIGEPENNARELVMQQALQLMQLSDQLDLLDRYSLIVAARAGNELQQRQPVSGGLANKPLP